MDRADVVPRWVRVALLGAVLLRLPFLLVQGQAGDLRLYRQWGDTLAHHPWSQFYALAQDPDHLPGDILLHGLVARTWAALGGSFTGVSYFAAVKAFSLGADLLAAVLVAALVRPRLGRRGAALAAAAFLWCPAVWFDSAWWGQWDVVSTAVLLAGLVVVDRAPSRWPLAVALLAWSVLVKPQLALAAGPVVVGLVLVGPGRVSLAVLARRTLGAGGVALAVVTALCLPFSVGLTALGSRWNLLDRVSYASDRYDALSMYAPNLWALAPDPSTSDSVRVGPVSAGTLGTMLLLSALAVVAVRWWRGRARGVDPLVGVLWWACCDLALFYALATRCHDRYLFPALVIGGVLAAIAARHRLPVAGLATVLSSILLYLLLRLDGSSGERVVLGVLAVLLIVSTAALVAHAPAPAVGSGCGEEGRMAPTDV